jgi:hypothetical protein
MPLPGDQSLNMHLFGAWRSPANHACTLGDAAIQKDYVTTLPDQLRWHLYTGTTFVHDPSTPVQESGCSIYGCRLFGDPESRSHIARM